MKKSNPKETVVIIKKVTAKAWWDKDAPMNITKDTKITIAPKQPQPTKTNTHKVSG